LAVAAACVFIFLASYRIELPGLYYDEVAFVNAAQGAPDNTFIYKRLGPVPVLINPYLGALKAWLYAPIFRLFGVSPVTVRLPTILLAAVTLLILYGAMRDTLGSAWAAIVVWIMAVDPANLFPSRLDWGPTVLMHFFQALILALWFSYRKKPQLWKLFMIVWCFGVGFFDKFKFCLVPVSFHRWDRPMLSREPCQFMEFLAEVFSHVRLCSAGDSKKRFVLPPRWFSDLHTDRDHASRGRSTPLFNDFSLASFGLRLPSEVAL